MLAHDEVSKAAFDCALAQKSQGGITMNCWEFKKCTELPTQQEKVIFCRKCEFYKTYADRF